MKAAKLCGPGPPKTPKRMAAPWYMKGREQATRMINSSRLSSRAPELKVSLRDMGASWAFRLGVVYQRMRGESKKNLARSDAGRNSIDGRVMVWNRALGV